MATGVRLTAELVDGVVPLSTRQMWTDLPQGKPEAQAADQDGYNGGKDQSGRTVANPDGIDLAGGVFWPALSASPDRR